MSYPVRHVSDPKHAGLELLASAIDELSERAANTRRFGESFNLKGKYGEHHHEVITGIPMNREIKISDGGEDFPGIDVKASARWDDPLLLHPVGDPLKAPVYFLVRVDPQRQLMQGLGYATRKAFAAAPTRDLGHGRMRCLRPDQLVTADYLIPRIFGAIKEGRLRYYDKGER